MIATVKSDYQPARQVVMDALGRDALARLHQPVPALDWAVVIGLPTLFAANAVVLASYSGVLWIAAFVLQGLLIQIFGYVVHDLFVHRRVGGRLGYYIGAVFELPLLFSRTWYARLHLTHHALMNTHDDTEAYKQDIDTRARRLLFLTLPGVLGLAWSFKKTSNAPRPAPLTPPDAQARRQLRVEAVLAILWVAAIVFTLVRWWQLAVFGYLLPLAIVAPAASTVRVILEHAECDPDNVFHCATFYRTGLVSGPVFFWDAGDCHVVHHLYPAIPFYRMPAAVAAMAPVFLAHGARERRSLLQLLHGWFWRNETHRTVWPR